MDRRTSIRSVLAVGDRRTTGRSAEVVAHLDQHPEKIPLLVECLFDDDPGTRMRAADAMEKLSRNQAGDLQPYAATLLDLLATTTEQEMRWHLAVLLPRLQLTAPQGLRTAEVLLQYLSDRSSIVKTFALQGMADLSAQFPSMEQKVADVLHKTSGTGTPAMRARSRKLLEKLRRL